MTGDDETNAEGGRLDAEAAMDHYRSAMRGVFAGRRFLHYGGPLAGIIREALAIGELGAERPFLLGDARGTGILPDPAPGEMVDLGLETTPGDIVGSLRVSHEAMSRLPAGVREAVDRWDPDGSARALCWITLHARDEVAGRRVFGGRRREWVELEDKTRADSLWDTAGVARAPSVVVDSFDRAGLESARRALDSGAGTVWAADSRDGANGGAQYTRPVRHDDDADAAAAWFRPRADRVRVMPLLEGIPCSIHGIVTTSGTVVLRPVELLVLPRADGGFLYSGCATRWDPPPELRREMRVAARRTADHLRSAHEFLGAFTVDGIATRDGFRPTELNPRPGAGLTCLSMAVPRLPIQALTWAAAEGVSGVDWRPDLLERVLVESADARRAGWAAVILPERVDGERVLDLVLDAGEFRPAGEGESKSGTLRWGTSPAGSFLRFQPEPELLRPPESFAPVAAAAFRAARRYLGADVPIR